jgi:hypothetical protein
MSLFLLQHCPDAPRHVGNTAAPSTTTHCGTLVGIGRVDDTATVYADNDASVACLNYRHGDGIAMAGIMVYRCCSCCCCGCSAGASSCQVLF